MNLTKISKFLAAAVLVSSLANPVGAVEGHWYCKRTSDHTQPPIPPEYSYVEKYGGYFLDHDHGDNCDDKVIYLTFDAGYENGNVAKVLDILKKHDATGCFFVLSHLVESNTDLVKRMFDEGHTVGNHTMKHKNMAKYGNEETFRTELGGLETLTKELTGHNLAKVYRPPEGSFSEENMKIVSEMGYKTIFWSFAYADWDNDKQPEPDSSLKKLLDHTHNGEILLLHPTSATNAAILDQYLTALEKQGYRFGSIEELCGL